MRILSRSSRKCTVTGIDSHELQGLDVVQCAALVQTNHGIVNLIMNEYACYGKGHTIHSSGQIEWFKNSVDDRSVQVGGKQRICTIDGYAMPLTCRGGLMYLSILGKPTDKDFERYPAVHLTGPHEWDPSVLDYTHPSGDGEPPWSNDPDERSTFDPNFDEFGDYTQRAIQTLSILDDSSSTLTPCPTFMANQHDFRTYQHAVNHEAPDYEKFRPYFGWVNVDTVQKTMEQSTQWGVSLPNTFPMKRHLKSRNPALNIPRRHEAVATDTVFSDTPAVDSGVKQAQVFVGRDTLVADAYPMKSGKQFVNTLEDNIRRWGAMDKLLRDSAKTEISNKVMDIIRAYHISNWHSDPYHQNQNPAEWRYRTIKSWTNTVMNRSGAPANCWLLCLIYVCYLLNHIACNALDGKIPLLALTGITPDISIILLFTFYQPVFYATYDQHFPSESEERAGYWVGFGEHCGDAMTHKILDHDTQKIIYRGAVRPKKSSTPNHRLAPHGGEVSTSSDPSEDKISSGSRLGYQEGSSPEHKAPTVFIRSRDQENPSGSKPMPTFDPSDLIGRTFLLPPEENLERHRAKVTRQVVEIIDQDNGQRVENINFILDIGNGKVEELISYNQLLEHLEMPKAMIWAWIRNFIGSEPSLDTKVLCLPQIQTGKEANIMFKLNGRPGRLPLNPSPSLLMMIQSHVQHMPNKMTYLLWRDGVDSEALPRRIRSLQEQLSKVRSGKLEDLKPICLGISSPETTWRPCNLTLKTTIANGMMPLSLKWNPCQNTKYSKSGIKQSLINIRKSQTLLKVIIGLKFI